MPEETVVKGGYLSVKLKVQPLTNLGQTLVRDNLLTIVQKNIPKTIPSSVFFGNYMVVYPKIKMAISNNSMDTTIKGNFITVKEKAQPLAIEPSKIKGVFLTVIGNKMMSVKPNHLKGIYFTISKLKLNNFELNNTLPFQGQMTFDSVRLEHPSEDKSHVILENTGTAPMSMQYEQDRYGSNYSELQCNYTVTFQAQDLITNEVYSVHYAATQKPLIIFQESANQ
ncbi:MAG: hypothetical protein ACPGJS_05530 [Flammeovirgaceae bacterium]